MTKAKILALLSVMALLASVPIAALAQGGDAQPVPPFQVVGNATINGEPAMDGTMVIAVIDGEKAGTGTVMDGKFSVDVMGEIGEMIMFYFLVGQGDGAIKYLATTDRDVTVGAPGVPKIVNLIAYSDAQPVPPFQVVGNATIYGEKAVDGTMVVAMIDGEKAGTGTVLDGKFSVDVMGEIGEMIMFYFLVGVGDEAIKYMTTTDGDATVGPPGGVRIVNLMAYSDATLAPITDDCVDEIGTLTGTATRSGSWADDCESSVSGRGYARYYTFSLTQDGVATIDLESGDANTYLYLREGETTFGTALYENDDHRGSTSASQIQETLAAGTYTVEATTNSAGPTGSFTLTIAVVDLPTVDVSRAAGSEDALVRLNSPIPLTVTFSRPVFGFTVDDIIVIHGAVVNFAGSDGDSIFTFEVTPNAIGEVTVGIPADAAEDADGNGNTAAPRFSLGIVYDDDRNGDISRPEVIAAIIDYFAGGITRAQTIELIVLYFASQAEPEPGPGISDDCIQTVSSDGTINGQWASGCDSETRSGSHARYYTITLDAYSEVTVRLESSAANTHLYLRRGDATSGTALHENDDHGGSTSVSQIQETLAAGSYTIEATTYSAGSTGSFTLTINGQSGAMPRDPALLRYAADNAGGPGAIYVGDINQLVGPAPGDSGSSSLGDYDGMVPLDALQDHLWLYESSYYRSLLDRANLTDPTPLSSTGESIVIQHACINRSLLPCRLIELYWAPNLEARTNGQLKLEVSSFPELGVAGPDTLHLVSDGTLSMADIHPVYVAWQLPAIEVQSLWGIYPDSATMYLSLTDMHPQLEAMVAEATGGGIIVNHNWYSGNDQFLFSKKALRTLADFEGLLTHSHSQALADWIRGMGAKAQFRSFAEVYAALERGILHAGVTGATPGYGQRWYEVTDYLNGPLRSMPSTNNVINADVWNDIPADLQQIFIEEGAKAELEQLRLTSIQNVIGVQRIIDAGMRLVEFSPELLDHSFDVAVIEHVIPGWLNRLGYPGEGDNAVAMFNEHVGPYVGLRIESGGSVAQVPISQGPHAGNTMEQVLTK